MAKVRCKVCEHERQEYCPIKKTKVRTNKARTCKSFIYAVNKVKIKHVPIAEMRPDWFHDRKGAINKMKKQQKMLEEQRKKEMFNDESYMPSILSGTGNAEHPVTGDLSRFTTTALKKD
ncbi:MAG: hypothetical protein DRI84_08150 [Bacteroidetes bacterium]|nr:MAG: hypothetical protein DRI84_08150 [Bacteroidota bacterium]